VVHPALVQRWSDASRSLERIGVDHVGIGSDFNHGRGFPNFSNAGDACIWPQLTMGTPPLDKDELRVVVDECVEMLLRMYDT